MLLAKLNPRSRLTLVVMLAVALVVVGGLAWAFGQQLSLAQQMQAEEQRLEQAVAAERARYDELIARLEYVQSEEYVELWARAEANMARPGEVTVVLTVDEDEELAADVQPTPSPEPEGQPFWVELWELLFGPAE